MAVPFEQFVVPPLPYTGVLVAGTAILLAILYAIRPPVTQKAVLSFVPWIISGAILHVFYQMGEAYNAQIFPPVIEPLFSAPAVYLSTFIGMGSIWVVGGIVGQTTGSTTEGKDYIAQYLAATGTGVLLALVGLLIWQALDPAVGPLRPLIPLVGLFAALILTFVLYIMLGTWRTYVIAEARYVGALVLFAHLFDGITTALGYDVLGSGERSVIPQRIMEFAGDLPTAQYIGAGWLFVVVKLLVAVFVIVIFADYVREEPTRGNLLFAIVAAVGLGPAMNNFFLFFLGVGV